MLALLSAGFLIACFIACVRNKEDLVIVFVAISFILFCLFGIIVFSYAGNAEVISENCYSLCCQNLQGDDESHSCFVTQKDNKFYFTYYDEVTKEYVEKSVYKEDYHELDSCEPKVKVTTTCIKPKNDFILFLTLLKAEEYTKYEIFVPKGATIEL